MFEIQDYDENYTDAENMAIMLHLIDPAAEIRIYDTEKEKYIYAIN